MEPTKSYNVKKIVVWSVIGLVVLILLVTSMGQVDLGNRGVKTRLGAYVSTLDNGFYFKTPFVDDVKEMDVQTQKVSQDATAASSDLQDVHTTIAVNYNVEPAKVGELYQNVGIDYQDVVIDPAIQETVKAATAKYTAEQLITQREKVRADIVVALVDKLSPQGIKVTQVSITDFKFSSSFSKAIEDKVTAEQNALAAKNKLAQVQFEAQQKVATAEADAKAIQIQAQAITQQGGAEYVRLQELKYWDGSRCTTYCFAKDTPPPAQIVNQK